MGYFNIFPVVVTWIILHQMSSFCWSYLVKKLGQNLSQVLARIGNDYQTNDELQPQSMRVIRDVGWSGEKDVEKQEAVEM